MEGKKGELEFIIKFIESRDDLNEIITIHQLCALWTALCLRHNLDVDTLEYDSKIEEMWAAMEDNPNNPFSSLEKGQFYNAMSKYLV